MSVAGNRDGLSRREYGRQQKRLREARQRDVDADMPLYIKRDLGAQQPRVLVPAHLVGRSAIHAEEE